MTPFALHELSPTTWKNGGGQTLTLACWPPGAGLHDFDWRVSIATIAADGPFSEFAGIDRCITLLQGPGVALQQGDGRLLKCLDTPFQPFAFSGDEPLHGQLLGGASEDFNVMTRRGSWQAQVQAHQGATTLAPAPHGLLLAWQGAWRLRPAGAAQPALHLAARHGLWWAGHGAATARIAAEFTVDSTTDTSCASLAWQAEPEAGNACLLSVRFHPAQP